MDFNSKNFRYVTEPFGKVMERAEAGERIYLRALSRDKPSERPANIQDDFSALAEDFCLPRELDSANRCLFSSVLRVSGRINMWLHYDVCFQICASTWYTDMLITLFSRLGHGQRLCPSGRIKAHGTVPS